ncbi:MAG: hypothetical protein PHN71_08570 [Candidatus Cloacimonetes bacterium]|nr:hypothetical protein [Candidatus Cloacimonadota bacterium]MDD3074140.1 hypothetical protein [Eubacteriales bacterium]MDD4079256.1 hypothetical protein [Eubacteriales bacterium]MDD4769432.1 hypothetical protein [Eubacteriales bacterium]
MINRAFSALSRNFYLILIPILMDLTSFIFALVTTGFWGESKVSLKLALDVGLPSISSIFDQNVLVSGVNINQTGALPGGIALILVLLFVLLGAYLEAGFIGLLHEVAKDNVPSLDTFVSYAKRFWLRFLGLRLIIFVFSLLGVFLAMLLSIIGVIAFLVIFLILRIKYIYWEFTMVSEDMGISEAFSRSRMHYENRNPELSSIIISILVANFIAALIVNLLWTPVVVFISIPIYCYVATALQLALMYNKLALPEQPVE